MPYIHQNPVNARKLTYEIILSKGLGRLTKRAEEMLYILVNNAIRKSSFYKDDDKYDAIQTSFLNIYLKWESFNPSKADNAFNYFTEVHKRSIAESINTFYDKPGLKKHEQKKMRFISIQSSNEGKGIYNF